MGYLDIAAKLLDAEAEIERLRARLPEEAECKDEIAATIKRCAQVAKDKASELYAEIKRNGDDGTLQGRASIALTVYNAILALKDKRT